MKFRTERGFTAAEMLVVLIIIGTLARFSIPNIVSLVRKARAVKAVSEIMLVRDACYSYYAQNGVWPSDGAAGEVPPQLARHLPSSFTFKRDQYELDWDNWELPGGLPGSPGSTVLLGVSITTDDAALGNAVMSVLDRTGAHFTTGKSYTYVIATKSDGP